MECRAIQFWTFSGLVGAFLDLGIAYLLLCGSTLAYFTSKFLGFFGLYLPCPCNGLFGNPNNNYCLQRFLVECPTETISNVHLSVKSKFPFDSIWARDQNNQLNGKVSEERSDGRVDVEGEASCTLVSDARKPQDLLRRESFSRSESPGLGVMNSPALKDGKFDLKGKGIANQRPRSGLRRRRKGAIENDKFSSVGSCEPVRPNVQGVPRSPPDFNKDIAEESLSINSSGADGFKDCEVAAVDIALDERVPSVLKSNLPVDFRSTNRDVALEEFRSSAGGELGFNGHEEKTITFLEQALEEEHAACAALYLELEKERSAAASAADEAMAMILRLQEEKASIEMEARQYQRLIEEKSAYDAEEMNLLKEILLRREREKHFLEKEVEGYRQTILGNEQSGGDIGHLADQQGQADSPLPYWGEDPTLMLQQISESIGKKGNAKNASRFSENEIRTVESQDCTLAFGKETTRLKCDKVVNLSEQGESQWHPSCDEVFQETGMASMGEYPFAQPIEVLTLEACSQFNNSCTPGVNELDKNTMPVQEDKKQSDLLLQMAQKMTDNHNEREIIITYDGENTEKHENKANKRSGGQFSSTHGTEPLHHDIHVISGESDFSNDVNANIIERRTMDAPLNSHGKFGVSLEAFGTEEIDVSGDCSPATKLNNNPDIKSSLDRPSGLPPLSTARSKSLLSDMRRYSMSAVDYEKLKIDTEVEWLRERLRIVQQGREKLNFSVEHRERGNVQLQLLEDIACQLREIRQLTASGKAMRQASLPLPSSKVLSRKRRCRSASLGVHHSS